MKRRIFQCGLILLFCFVINMQLFSAVPSQRRIHAGFLAGIGLPKISDFRFRTPVSVLGGGNLNYRLHRKMALQVDGYGLTTFNLGTVDERKGELRFNLLWSSVDFMYHIRGMVKGESFILAGVGEYNLSQQFDRNETILNTLGFNLGIVSWQYRKRWNSIFEVRWHLLFRPSTNPQVLTVTFGVML